MATAWIRSLDGSEGAQRRHVSTDRIIAAIWPWQHEPTQFNGAVHLSQSEVVVAVGTSRDAAKAKVDEALRELGYRLADVPGHTIEES